jgi:hypothetical protein
MNLHNLYDALRRADVRSDSKGLLTPSGWLLAWGNTVPTDATTGYAPGALFFHIDSSGQTSLYKNDGSSTSCDFNALTTDTMAGPIVLGDNETLALGDGTDATLKWDATDLVLALAATATWVMGTDAALLNMLLRGSLSIDRAAAAGAVALRFGETLTEGGEIRVMDEDVAIVAGASTDLTQNVPAGSVILMVQANLETIVTATTAVKVGIGVSADPDAYGKTSALTKNLKVDTVPDWAAGGSAIDVKVFAVDTNGAAAGTLDTGTVRVRIIYWVPNSLDDAA